MRNADAAMYKAKYDGRSTYRYFTAEIGQQAEYWVEVEHGLKQGLAREEFSLVYQPQVNPQSGETEVVEVLLRWNSARLGQVPPGRFIPIAEEAGSIIEIGDWVLERLCQHINVIGAQSPDNLRYAVNVSGRQLKDPEFVSRALAILEKYRVPAARIEFELTESILIEHEVSVEALQQIKAHGIRLSLDDFGVGYSSLSYLSRYPFDTLKIDRSFVRNINHVDGGATNLCDMIIGIANRLGLQIVAEGVESEGQYEFLRSHGVHLLQGFFLCEPLPKEAMMGFVQRSLPD